MRLSPLVACGLLWGHVANAQSSGAAGSAVSVRVEGAVDHPYTLDATELAAMPRREVTASGHGSPSARYEGVLLRTVLERAGVELGPALRGPRLASYVAIDATDGYRVVFALAELDSAFTTRRVLLADRVDGRPLPADAGPMRIIVSDETRPARWVRKVSRIRVLSAPSADAAPHPEVPR